jgi:hypothetical protein
MNAALALRDAARPVVGVHPDQGMTPIEALDDGDKEAVAAFMDYVRSEFMKWELEDYLRANDRDITVRGWMKAWSKKVQEGEL